MKAAEIRELIKQHEQRCVAIGQSLSLAELKLMAQTVFPAGTLPGESNTIEFTTRELEIFRHLLWKTTETERRWVEAMMQHSLAHSVPDRVLITPPESLEYLDQA
jgi:hypothetical protein